MSAQSTTPLFRILLKHRRGARGMSQLDLASAAGVSARHISFMETGRAQPSREMALRLGASLGLGLKEQNELLTAAGFEPAYPAAEAGAFEPAIERALERMMTQQEPYPLLVMDRAATTILARFVADPSVLGPRLNLLEGVFDPRKFRPAIEDWETLARHVLTRAQRDALAHPEDDELRALVHTLCSFPDVPEDWLVPDLGLPMTPVLPVTLTSDVGALSFVTTLTIFNAPQDVTLESLRIESYFPMDEETERLCREWAGA